MFLGHLKEIGHEVTYTMFDDAPSLKYYEKFFFDNIILMTPSAKEAEVSDGLRIDDLVSFFTTRDEQHNLMVFGDREMNRYVRSLANNFGVDFEDYLYEMHDSSNQSQ